MSLYHLAHGHSVAMDLILATAERLVPHLKAIKLFMIYPQTRFFLHIYNSATIALCDSLTSAILSFPSGFTERKHEPSLSHKGEINARGRCVLLLLT